MISKIVNIKNVCFKYKWLHGWFFVEKGEEEVSISFSEECRGGHRRPAAVRARGEDAPLHEEDPGAGGPQGGGQEGLDQQDRAARQ